MRNDFVPSLATDLPPAPEQEGDLWTITVAMVQDAVWSDGTPITANDANGDTDQMRRKLGDCCYMYVVP